MVICFFNWNTISSFRICSLLIPERRTGFTLGQLDHKIFSVWQEYQIFLNLLWVILKRKPKIMLFRQSFKNSMSFKEVISPKVCGILDVGWFYATYRRIYLWYIHGCYRPMHADNPSYLHECYTSVWSVCTAIFWTMSLQCDTFLSQS